MNWYRTAQERDFDVSYESPYLQDLVRDVVKTVIPPEPIQINTSACETAYDVGGIKVRVWVISDGTTGNMSDKDAVFSQRFNISDEKWRGHHYDASKGCYDHQDPSRPQGPTYDIIPGGKKALQDFAMRIRSKMALRQERYEQLPIGGYIHSPRTKTPSGMQTINANIGLQNFWGPKITTPWQVAVANRHPTWRKLNDWFKSLRGDPKGIDEISQEEFNTLLPILQEGVQKNSFK